MVGYGPEKENFVFELTYNYGIKAYSKGDDFRYVVINDVDDGIWKRAVGSTFQTQETSEGKVVISPGF